MAFTFYESESEIGVKSDKSRHYYEGIRDNLALMREHYPGYVMRLYYEATESTEAKLCRLGEFPICWIKSIKKLIPTLGLGTNLNIWFHYDD